MAAGPVAVALKALIVADSGVTTLIATAPLGFGGGPAVYDEGGAPQVGRVFPDIVVGAEVGDDSVGTFQSPGWNCTVQVKAISQSRDASQGRTIVTALLALLRRGRVISVSGYTSSWIDGVFQPSPIETTVAGVVTREFPLIVRVWAT